MTTLRASSGISSLGVIFWLIAAILKNERIGPGMETSSAAEEPSEPDDRGAAEAVRAERCAGAGGTAPQERPWNPAISHRQPLSRKTNRMRRDFMAQPSTDRWRR